MKKSDSPSGKTCLISTGYGWDICYKATLLCPDNKLRKAQVQVGSSNLIARISYKGTTVTGEIHTSDYRSYSDTWEYSFIPYGWLKNGKIFK